MRGRSVESGKIALRRLWTALLLAALLFQGLLPLRAEAADGAVEGKVASGTTDELLRLETNGEIMLIKLDSDLKVTGGALVIGAKVRVEYSYGSDRYLHTSSIKVTATNWGAVVDSANTITVTGKLLNGTNEGQVAIEYSGSQFIIRLDADTVFEKCFLMEKDEMVGITVARASDGYFHAVKISGSAGNVSFANAITGVPEKTSDGRTIATVSGVIQDGTTDAVLKIKVGGNVFQVKIDSGTDITQIRTLIPGTTINLAVYTGSDNAFHAYKLVGAVETAESARSGAAVTVTGTVQKNTTDRILYLHTNSGDLTIKLDKDTDNSANGLLVIGKSVDVVIQRGSDAYLHASKITGKSGSQATGTSVAMSNETTKSSSSVKVEGTVESNTTNAILYLRTSNGVMTILIDKNTGWTSSKALRAGQTVSAMVYRGSDAYIHAESVSSSLSSAPATTLNGASQLSFSGTLEKVDGYTITIKNSDGSLEFRFDNSTDFSGYRLLQTGKNVTITAVMGSDGYWRAQTVVG